MMVYCESLQVRETAPAGLGDTCYISIKYPVYGYPISPVELLNQTTSLWIVYENTGQQRTDTDQWT